MLKVFLWSAAIGFAVALVFRSWAILILGMFVMLIIPWGQERDDDSRRLGPTGEDIYPSDF